MPTLRPIMGLIDSPDTATYLENSIRAESRAENFPYRGSSYLLESSWSFPDSVTTEAYSREYNDGFSGVRYPDSVSTLSAAGMQYRINGEAYYSHDINILNKIGLWETALMLEAGPLPLLIWYHRMPEWVEAKSEVAAPTLQASGDFFHDRANERATVQYLIRNWLKPASIEDGERAYWEEGFGTTNCISWSGMVDSVITDEIVTDAGLSGSGLRESLITAFRNAHETMRTGSNVQMDLRYAHRDTLFAILAVKLFGIHATGLIPAEGELPWSMVHQEIDERIARLYRLGSQDDRNSYFESIPKILSQTRAFCNLETSELRNLVILTSMMPIGHLDLGSLGVEESLLNEACQLVGQTIAPQIHEEINRVFTPPEKVKLY